MQAAIQPSRPAMLRTAVAMNACSIRSALFKVVKLALVTAVVASAPLATSGGAEIKARGKLAEALAMLRDYHLRTTCYDEKYEAQCQRNRGGRGGGETGNGGTYSCTRTRTVCPQVFGKLTPATVNIVDALIQVGRVKPRTLPDRIISGTFVGNNCTSMPRMVNETVGLSGTQRRSVTLRDTMTETLGASINAGFNISGVSGGANLQWTQHIVVGKDVQEGEDQVVRRDVTINQVISAGHQLMCPASISERKDSVDFAALVTVDSDLEPNAEGISKASDVLTKEQRTFSLSGSLDIVHVSDITVSFVEQRLTKQECEDIAEARMDANFVAEGVPPAEYVFGEKRGTYDVLDHIRWEREDPNADTYLRSFIAKAQPPREVKASLDSMDTTYWAEGTHSCRANQEDAGTCQVSGTGFVDCGWAETVLRSNECCGVTYPGGMTVGFRMNQCNPEARAAFD